MKWISSKKYFRRTERSFMIESALYFTYQLIIKIIAFNKNDSLEDFDKYI